MRSASPFPKHQANGSALMIMLILLGIVAVVLVSALKGNPQIARDRITADALAKAKEALIGYAVTYRDSHAGEVFGYLPCPATDGNGDAAPNCGDAEVTQIGLLPWKTLGLPPLRDSSGECLWYAVSGRFKYNPKTAVLNWDTTGQLIINDAGGATLASSVSAVIFSPHGVIQNGVNGNQDRTPAGTTECGGNTTVAAYLDGGDPIYAGTAPTAGANSTLTVATAASIANGTNNDQGLWITPDEIFKRIKQRKDFKTDMDAMMADFAVCLNNMPPASLPAASPGNKGIDNANTVCPAVGTQKINVRTNWKENLLYAKPVTTVNGNICNAVLLFGGERTTRTVAPLVAQTRVTTTEKGDATIPGDSAMYLEGVNATLFPGNGGYTGTANFSNSSPSADVTRCIKGLPAGATQKSFANPADFAGFVTAGVGVTTTVPILPSDPPPSVSISPSGVTAGGCFWQPNAIPLAGKTLRVYYDFKFFSPDTFALTGSGADRGNGFTLDMVRGTLGDPTATCGSTTNMGALGAADVWGSFSFIVETDVHKNSGRSDPGENHTAIMVNGNFDHSLSGSLSTACNGTATGCRHSPANKFEESPIPLSHNQRIEIHTGCNATCTGCNPASHAAPNTYAKISTWVDCEDCNDVVVDFLGDEFITAPENRDFSMAGNWVGTNWSVTSGAFSHLAGANAATLPNSALTGPPVAGSAFQVAVTVETATSGTLVISFGGASSPAISLTAGAITDYTVQLTAASSGALTLTPDANWAGTIDNVSVAPVKTPTANRCIALDPSMNSIYFAFTGGFLSSTDTSQGVTIKNFMLRSE